jgi:hypothetical protein
MPAMRALAALALLLAACSSGVDVRGGAGDPHYDFQRLKTYSWMPREPTGDPRIDESLLDDRVHRGVDEDLARQGYRLVPEGGDFAVGYRAVLGTQREVEGGESFEGIWTEDHTPRSAGGGETVDKVVLEGTLVLRIFDGKTRNLVWEAAAETEINPKQSVLAPTREDKVRAAIRKMLDMFEESAGRGDGSVARASGRQIPLDR